MMCKDIPIAFAALANKVFKQAIQDYQQQPSIDRQLDNPYPETDVEHFLYAKNVIDNIQWDMEDIIRDPEIEPEEAVRIKRRIDRSNQKRTDMVELLDGYFLDQFSGVDVKPQARINTESPAWALDRLSILQLKIYHMHKQLQRRDATAEHLSSCEEKLKILLEQEKDLSQAIDELLEDIREGRKYMKVYKQMKMYNDPAMNPLLRGKAL